MTEFTGGAVPFGHSFLRASNYQGIGQGSVGRRASQSLGPYLLNWVDFALTASPELAILKSLRSSVSARLCVHSTQR